MSSGIQQDHWRRNDSVNEKGIPVVVAWDDGRKGIFMWSDKPIEARTAEEIEQIRTPNGIRQRIYEATFHDPLVRNVFTLAYREGLSGEDLYVLLAYHALVAKQKLEQHIVEDLMTRLPEPIVHAKVTP